MRQRPSLHFRWLRLTSHYAYFRGAEYPMGRIPAAWYAYKWGWKTA